MHGGLPFDFDTAKRDLIEGRIRWSASDIRCVALVRYMADVLVWSSAAAADALSTPTHTVSRSAVIGLARRAGITFKAKGHKGGGHATRRARLAVSNNLSTHKVRLQRVVAQKKQPFGYMPFESVISGSLAVSSEAARRIAARRRTVPRCMWAGCGGELENPDKDCYCLAHKKGRN